MISFDYVFASIVYQVVIRLKPMTFLKKPYVSRFWLRFCLGFLQCYEMGYKLVGNRCFLRITSDPEKLGYNDYNDFLWKNTVETSENLAMSKARLGFYILLRVFFLIIFLSINIVIHLDACHGHLCQ